uniref:Uncharacterized protein n=1 Tax=Sphaerodactylus townsendi TaxID=933632 RepID=A0ACB8F2L7_9SAUR
MAFVATFRDRAYHWLQLAIPRKQKLAKHIGPTTAGALCIRVDSRSKPLGGAQRKAAWDGLARAEVPRWFMGGGGEDNIKTSAASTLPTPRLLPYRKQNCKGRSKCFRRKWCALQLEPLVRRKFFPRSRLPFVRCVRKSEAGEETVAGAEAASGLGLPYERISVPPTRRGGGGGADRMSTRVPSRRRSSSA